MGLSAAPELSVIGRPPSGLPEPEDVFLSWLMAQPANADLAVAADGEISRLSHYRGPHSGPQRLQELFQEFRLSLGVERLAHAGH